MGLPLLFAVAMAAATPAETRLSVDLKDAAIVDVVRLLAEVGRFQTVVDPGVSCSLTLTLKDVAWPKVLDVALRSCRLGYEEDNGVVRVATLATLTAEAAGRARLAEQRRSSGPLETTRYRLSYARAQEIAPLLRKLLSPRGEVVVDARTNTLIVTDVP